MVPVPGERELHRELQTEGLSALKSLVYHGLGRVSNWLTVTKTESALEYWGLPGMQANLFFQGCPGAPDLPILSPQPGSLRPPWCV